MPRVGAGKTATIKQRRIEVYLPSLETKAQWTAEAARRRMSISEMVFLLLHDRFNEDEVPMARKLKAAEARVETLEAELAGARARVAELELIKERHEKDLAEYRAQAFIGGGAIRRVDPRLWRLLADAKDTSGRPRNVTETEIKRALRITPQDKDQAKALVAQLVFLEEFQLIRHSQGGWVWNA